MSEKAPEEPKKVQRANNELQQKYDEYKMTLASIREKVGELEGDAEEHMLVIDTLKSVPKDRKCFRMIGGVLTEKTSGEVLPILEKNYGGIKNLLKQLLEEYAKLEKEFADWQKEKNINVMRL